MDIVAPQDRMEAEERKRPRVYVVDDDHDVRESLQFLLESITLEVVSCPDSETFLEMYDPDAPGCVVLDVRLPGLSGFELLKKLQQIRPSAAAIMITAYSSFSTAVRALKAGALNILEKPLSGQALLDSVTGAIELDRRTREIEHRYAEVRSRYANLTPRQRQVLLHLLKGHRTRDIANNLGISIRTAEGYRARVLGHMQVKSVAGLVRLLWPLKDQIDDEFLS